MNESHPDEIDLMLLIKPLQIFKKVFIYTFLSVFLVSMLHFIFAPKTYYAKTTFVIPEDQGSSNSSGLGRLSLFLNSRTSFGGSQFSNYIETLSKTKRLKMNVLDQFEKKVSLSGDQLSEHHISFSKLNFQFNEGVYQVSYESKDPSVILTILDIYLSELESLYLELKLGSQKNQIIVLDPALLPESHYRPKLKMNLFLGVFGGVFLGLFLTYSTWFFQYFRGKLD